MNTSRPLLSLRTALLLLSGLVLFVSQSAAQAPAFTTSSALDLWEAPSSQSVFDTTPSSSSLSRMPHLRLFRFASGFLSDPLGLQQDECELPGVPRMPGPNAASTPESNDGPEWLQFGMGADNPFFDLRRPGDPGGIGYYRVNTQVALIDSPKTCCSIGMQTVMPGGIQFAGVPNGPTVFSPSLGVFHTLNDRLGLQSFVSKNFLLTNTNGGSVLQRNVQCGLALQRPLLVGQDGLNHLFFCMGALGNVSQDRDGFKLLPSYDLLPGLQWHVNENWWLSSAVLVPMGSVRSTPGQWQLTCSLRF